MLALSPVATLFVYVTTRLHFLSMHLKCVLEFVFRHSVNLYPSEEIATRLSLLALGRGSIIV